MAKILLNSNATTGVDTFYETAEDLERATTTQEVSELTDYAADMRRETHGEKFGEFRKMAVMPMSVVGQAMREGWLFDKQRVRKWVCDNPVFKTFDKNF